MPRDLRGPAVDPRTSRAPAGPSLVLSLVASASLIACGASDPAGRPDGGGAEADGPVADGAPGGVAEIDLGPVTTGEPRTVSIPPDTLGFHVVVEIEDGEAGNVGVESIESPSGERVLADFAPVGHPAPIGGSTYGIAAVSVPMTSAAMPVAPGDWTLVFHAPPGRDTRARVLVRTTADGEFHGGTLDLKIYVPEGLGIAGPDAPHAISAADAAGDPCAIERVDAFFATLDELFGLARGEVEFVAIDAAFASIADDAARLRALAETVAPAEHPAAHFVWVDELVLFDTPVWGNSAWVPGTATHAGHPLSGVVVDVTSGNPPAADGMTMVHELGHFLGLFHTTEANPAIHDPLSDTPMCAGRGDGCTNIMYVTFYGATGGVGLTSTPEQRRVVHGSPLYRAD